jgi:penicillin-binding protein 2
MFKKINKFIKYLFQSKKGGEISPDEILLDSRNLPNYDISQFEGRIEQSISKKALFTLVGAFFLIALIFVIQSFKLQVIHGQEYLTRSENNTLRPIPLFAGRGIITDRNGIQLAWNAPLENATSSDTVAVRRYATSTGLSHILGYVKYPSKDNNGFYYQDDFEGEAGAEKYFDEQLQGIHGVRLVEVDAHNKVVSESMTRPSIQGKNVKLSIDSRVQSVLYQNIKDVAEKVGFAGGAGVIVDLNSGQVIALTSYPEYSSQVMSDKKDNNQIRAILNDKSLPFLDRAIDGLYTPGSIVKLFIALGVLNEKIIDPDKIIVTNGSLSIPNPYDDTKSTVFRDWKNHGPISMRQALAVSSDVYFYTVGGGFKDQKGLGIRKIDEYLQMFGFGTTTLDNSSSFLINKAGTIPTPEWKKKTFNEAWFVGNTYHTSIGQYGFQVTPIQIARAVSAVANNGTIYTPTILADEKPHIESVVPIPKSYFDIIHDGMRMSVTSGTSASLNIPFVEIAAKSGTAELGYSKEKINSWMTGFWPYKNPRYAFVVMLEKGTVNYQIGAGAVIRQTLEWIRDNAPEYLNAGVAQ